MGTELAQAGAGGTGKDGVPPEEAERSTLGAGGGAEERWGQQRPEFGLLLGTREPPMPQLGVRA